MDSGKNLCNRLVTPVTNFIRALLRNGHGIDLVPQHRHCGDRQTDTRSQIPEEAAHDARETVMSREQNKTSDTKEDLERLKLRLEADRLEQLVASEKLKLDLEIERLRQDIKSRYRNIPLWGGVATVAGVLFSIIFGLVNTSRSISEARDLRIQQHQASVSTAFSGLMSQDDDTFVKGIISLVPAAASEPRGTFLSRLKDACIFNPGSYSRDDLRHELAEDSDPAKIHVEKFGVEEPITGGRVQMFLTIAGQLPPSTHKEIFKALLGNKRFGSERLTVVSRLAELEGPDIWNQEFDRGNSRTKRVLATMLAHSPETGIRILTSWVTSDNPTRASYALAVGQLLDKPEGVKLVMNAVGSKNPEIRVRGLETLPRIEQDMAQLIAEAERAFGDTEQQVRLTSFYLVNWSKVSGDAANKLLLRGLTDSDERVVSMAVSSVTERGKAAKELLPVLQRLKKRQFKDVFLEQSIDDAIRAVTGEFPFNR
jgi:hypothetical protein